MKTFSYGSNSTKICTKCKRDLPLGNFRKYSGRSRDGLRPLCSECQRAYERRWRSASKEYRRETRKKRAAKEAAYRQNYDAIHRGKMLSQEAGRRASKKGIPFDLYQYEAQIEERIVAGCEMTGLPFDLHSKGQAWNSPSIDRIIPAEGYVYTNIRIVCFAMNAAMGNWGETVLQQIITAWQERQ